MRLAIAVILSFMMISAVQARDSQLYQAKRFQYSGGSLQYRILYPHNFTPDKTYPLLLFLHGSGERGGDNLAQLTHGASLFTQKDIRQGYPAIVIFPQAPAEDDWANVEVDASFKPYKLTFSEVSVPVTASMQGVLALMDELSAKPFVDRQRIYVGGLSMGAMGTYEILARRPQMFAAAIAICGGGNPENAGHYRQGLPLWAFHGEEDQVVAPSLSVQMVEAINQHGGNAKLTLYSETGHNSWDKAFAEPALLAWLFSHQLDD